MFVSWVPVSRSLPAGAVWSFGYETRAVEGHTGFEPVNNSVTGCFLCHMDHDPVPDKGIEP